MNSLNFILILMLVQPLIFAGIIAVAAGKRHSIASILSVLSAACGAILYFVAMGIWAGADHAFQPHHFDITWLQLGALEINIGVYWNATTALMALVVTCVGFLIHLFSFGYMADDDCKSRYFGGLSIFMFSMLGIVLASNLFMVFIFWELVGFSSYLLIGHYFNKRSAADASKKAFIVNRVGDFGFLLGIIWVWHTFGTTDLVRLADMAGHGHGTAVATGLGLLLFCGVLGKSAQMPLHVWLPDAMEGPTPVSALIHAATMVAAGVYFLCRIPFLFTAEALNVVTWVGTVTALYAALCAFVQSDIKRVLAYSTLSQLGYMVAAFGLGASIIPLGGGEHGGHGAAVNAGVVAAMFHLTTHAFFKALMFLGSGSVIHACHHEQDIFKMGGLAKKMPITFATFGIGVLAISGIPFLSGYFSKDSILYLAQHQSSPVFYILTGTALLTATYMGRLFVIAFLGKPKSENAEHAHESPIVMTLPLIILAILSIGGGYYQMYAGPLHAIGEFVHAHPHGEGYTIQIISGVAAVLGLGFAFIFYRPGATEDSLQQKVPAAFEGLTNLRNIFDIAYNAYVKNVQDSAAAALNWADRVLLGGMIVRGTAAVTGLVGMLAKATHVGSVGAYVYWFALGLIVFGSYLISAF